ncbi:MAG: hypothetical protein UY72_C0005G0007 [Candidatus Uhrbacteria bacterium GW2011_GWD2_52_7]|uniref:Uncharacterized protein n=1 Tax=Candidatus Uhrbacteria bacterium GW2011_GWD2_52_7 TaxID=1618989 RepID=A0A0G1XIC2_9BACT|nr:MAG: hypothetical protein UY72_C0005G0007 [Candidatus Uhrbacteria bacterium GW2011_GWD2_52_7]
MSKKPRPVAAPKRDNNRLVIEAPTRRSGDAFVNRHASVFQDRKKTANRKACRTAPRLNRGEFDFLHS